MTNSGISLPQDLWSCSGTQLNKQTRRSQIVDDFLQKAKAALVLDVGCAEGFITSQISGSGRSVVGIDLHLNSLRRARLGAGHCDFLCASMTHLPFRDASFDAVCVLEVLEHLPSYAQKAGLNEIVRVLRVGGTLVVSVPYKQEIHFVNREGRLVPDNEAGHLHTFDEGTIASIMPSNLVLNGIQTTGAFVLVSCALPLRRLPLALWLPINDICGVFRKSEFMVAQFCKV